jgi:iron-sulfur cluster assembly protein
MLKMIQITENAESALRGFFFRGKEIAPIRIFLETGNSEGPSLEFVQDQQKETDDVCDVKGFTVLINRELHGKIKGATIRFSSMRGFRVDPEVPVGDFKSVGGS